MRVHVLILNWFSVDEEAAVGAVVNGIRISGLSDRPGRRSSSRRYAAAA